MKASPFVVPTAWHLTARLDVCLFVFVGTHACLHAHTYKCSLACIQTWCAHSPHTHPHTHTHTKTHTKCNLTLAMRCDEPTEHSSVQWEQEWERVRKEREKKRENGVSEMWQAIPKYNRTLSQYREIYHNIENSTRWRRLVGSPKLQIIFHKRATKYRSLLRKMTFQHKGSYPMSLRHPVSHYQEIHYNIEKSIKISRNSSSSKCLSNTINNTNSILRNITN